MPPLLDARQARVDDDKRISKDEEGHIINLPLSPPFNYPTRETGKSFRPPTPYFSYVFHFQKLTTTQLNHPELSILYLCWIFLMKNIFDCISTEHRHRQEQIIFSRFGFFPGIILSYVRGEAKD